MPHAVDLTTTAQTAHPRPGAAGLAYKIDAEPSLMSAGVGVEPPAEMFEQVYRAAAGDASKIPWADRQANPPLVEWLGADGPSIVRPGARVVVVGCGLGDDVAELNCRGYDATGFDVAPTAIDWARRRFGDLADRFLVADLFALPERLRRRFDLVIEIYTIQSLAPATRRSAAAAIASLCRPRGTVLAICRGRDRCEPLDQVQGPPYPLTACELGELFEREGFAPTRTVDEFVDDRAPPTARLRAAFRRG